MPPQAAMKLPPGATLVSDGTQAGSATMALPPGATLVDSSAPSAPQTSTQATPPGPGMLSRFLTGARDVVAPSPELKDYTVAPGLLRMAMHPADSAGLLWDSYAGGQQGELDKAKTLWNTPGQKFNATMHGLYSMIPFVGPALGHAGSLYESGDYAGGTGATLGTAASMLMGMGAGKPVPTLEGTTAAALSQPKAGPGMFAKSMREKPVGEEFTRGQQLDGAQAKGVNLDAADATGSGFLRGMKNYAERSLGGRGTMKENTNSNLHALNTWTDQTLNELSPDNLNDEALGSKMQSALRDDHAQMKASASKEFKDLDERLGPNTIDGTGTVEAEARKIIADKKDYYDAHPELRPKQAWSILENLAQRPQVDVPQQQPGAGFGGGMVTKMAKADAPTHNFSWSELHQLRSDLMEAYRNSPDLTKSQPEAWLQRMVETIDNAMTDASSGLTPNDKAQFRTGNEIWEKMKSTYDNPQHPFYQAVRSQFPSEVPDIVGSKTPELARQVQNTLGGLKGAVQRRFVSRLLDPNGDGVYDFKGLAGRVGKVPDDYLLQQLGFAGASNLKMLAKVAKTVTDNVNPSGTADVMVPAGEIAGLLTHPVAAGAEIAGAYGTARALTGPGMVKRMTSAGGQATAPVAAAKSPVGAFAAPATAQSTSQPQREEDTPDGYVRVKSHLRRVSR